MNTLRNGAAGALIAAICLGLAAPGLAQSVEEDVSAAYAAWDAAFNAADTQAIAGAYAEDALLLPPSHEVITGPEAIAGFFAPIFEMGATGHKLEMIEAFDNGGAVIGTAKWSAMGKDAAGADQPWGGLSTTVFERQPDGSLKLKVHTFN